MKLNPSEAPTSRPSLPRRDFLTLSSLTLAAAALDSLPAMAGPFGPSDFETLIPADKKLTPEWVRSLYERGKPTVYRKSRNELRFIGMPIGGLMCGTLYLSGDGRLWLWDIFNANQTGILPRRVAWDGFGNPGTVDPQNGANYVAPSDPTSPLVQGFALKVGETVRSLDASGWQEIAFRGEYPLGIVEYSDSASPIAVTLTTYSPFIPLQVDDSSLPATICEFTLHNTSRETVTAEIGGMLENATSISSARPGAGQRVNTTYKAGNSVRVSSRFHKAKMPRPADAHADIALLDFNRADWGNWKVEGTAFGTGPLERSKIMTYQGDVGGKSGRVINSHSSAPAGDIGERDSATGRLTSPSFVISRRYLSFYIGGGANADEVGLRLRIGDKVARRAAGRNENRMRSELFDLAEFSGQTATLEIYDNGKGAWGNIGVDALILTDQPQSDVELEKERDWGTVTLACLAGGIAKAELASSHSGAGQNANAKLQNVAALFSSPASSSAQKDVGESLIGGITHSITLKPGETKTVPFVVAWHFANTRLPVADAGAGNEYAKRFADSDAVVAFVAKEYSRLSRDTKRWHATWRDSTLPHWFLERTFVNTSILATSTAHRFGTGRFWGWEGIGCCEGTCTHVWHYAQAVGRVFPELERHTREFVDFGTALVPDTGEIGYRGERTGPAVDGQCGRILGAWREHTMSADDRFLRRIWPRVKLALGFLMRHDADHDGLLDGAQENTLDAAWFGKIAWISSLYAAALRAGEAMATDMGDAEFAATCRERLAQTKAALESQLFNGEYFIQKPAPGKENALGTYQTCHIDQVHGQSWAWQAGLGRVLDREKTVSALRALYKYNFTPDVGPFRRKHRPGRPYAVAGDGGLIMATNPKELTDPFGNSADWQFGYFNECMSGFEHQAASHMIAEGLVKEGLAVVRAIHDRYHATRRNPFNEIECSDHYSRAMASYGSFVTLCGFRYHGPKGQLAFAPRVTPEAFRAPFITAEGWGTFAQTLQRGRMTAEVELSHGNLRLTSLALQGTFTKITAKAGGKVIPATLDRQNEQTTVTFASALTLQTGQKLNLTLA